MVGGGVITSHFSENMVIKNCQKSSFGLGLYYVPFLSHKLSSKLIAKKIGNFKLI